MVLFVKSYYADVTLFFIRPKQNLQRGVSRNIEQMNVFSQPKRNLIFLFVTFSVEAYTTHFKTNITAYISNYVKQYLHCRWWSNVDGSVCESIMC